MTSPGSLEDFRARINALDAELLALLAKRRRLVGELFAWKDAHGLPRIDGARENDLRSARCVEGESLGVPAALTESVFAAILADARSRT